MYGISLDTSGTVDVIDLSSNHLTGSIPIEVGDLVNLTSLVLDDNHLADSIPVEVGDLVTLTSLVLNDNHLIGIIPSSFGNLTNLTAFDISNNSLSGCYDPGLGASNAGGSSLEPGGTTYERPASTTLTVTDFDPSKDVIDLGPQSIHNQIVMDGPDGLMFQHMFNQNSTLILEGVFLKNLQWFNFLEISDAHLQQDLSAALAYENCTGLSRPNTVYIRSHEQNIVETVSFNPATDKISFFYLCVRGDQGFNFQVEQTNDGARFYSPYSGQSITLEGIDFSDLNSEHFEWRANQLEDNLAGRIGLDTAVTGFQIINANVFNGKSVPMAGGVDKAPYHIYSYPDEYTGSPICQLGSSILCDFSNAFISDGNSFDEPWEDFCSTSAGACGSNSGPTSGVVPVNHLQVESADIYLDDANHGVILTSPSGLCYRLRVEDDGSFTSELVDCP